jgi:FkbM family methyltransferase
LGESHWQEAAVSALNLRLKSAIVGSPLDGVAQQLRWISQIPHRRKHPELWEIYLEEQRLPAVLQKLLKPNSNAVDVGCHLGSFLNLLNNIAPNGKHIAIEPSRSKGKWLRQKFPTTEILNVAVGDKPGRAIFEENIKNPGYSKLLGDGDKTGNSYYDVEVCRLDDVLTKQPDLLKLDVEGGELSALRGAGCILQRWHPPILFECGSEYLVNKPSRRDLYDLLIGQGYKILSFGDFLFDKGPMEFDEFRRCGLYPFRAFNFIAL